MLTAIEARQTTGDRPDIYIFRKTEEPRFRFEEFEHVDAQAKKLREFSDCWLGASAIEKFETIPQFEGTVENLLRGWIKRNVLEGRPVAWPVLIKGSPFCGLSPFDANHAPVFFGRTRVVEQAIARLKQAAADKQKAPFLLAFGASGVGKSSLVQAELVPQLTAEGEDVDVWRTVLMRPGTRAIDTLAEALFTGTPYIPGKGAAPPSALPELAGGDYKTPQKFAQLLRGGHRRRRTDRDRAGPRRSCRMRWPGPQA